MENGKRKHVRTRYTRVLFQHNDKRVIKLEPGRYRINRAASDELAMSVLSTFTLITLSNFMVPIYRSKVIPMANKYDAQRDFQTKYLT